MPNKASAGDPPWMQSLHPIDRVHARQWLRQVGEARMRKILAAITTKRSRGNQEKHPPAKWIDVAVDFYLTSNLSPGDAAGKAADEIKNVLRWEAPTRDRVRVILSEQIKSISKAELLGRARALRASGRTIRVDIFPEIAADIDAEKRAAALRVNAERATASIARLSLSSPQLAGAAIARIGTLSKRVQRAVEPADFSWLTRFTDAFPGLVPDDMPVSTVHRLRSTVELYLREEAEAWKRSSPNL